MIRERWNAGQFSICNSSLSLSARNCLWCKTDAVQQISEAGVVA